jgi:hypothetical protein
MNEKRTLLDVLDFEELEILENLVGKEYHEIFAKGFSAKASYSLHWILEKRSNPDAKIEDSKKKKLPFLNEYLKGFLNDPKEN